MNKNHNALDIRTVALKYHAEGFPVMPCRKDKRPIGQWHEYTVKRANESDIDAWFSDYKYQSIGLVLGNISKNMIAIDLDGIEAIKQFHARNPSKTENTRAVLTGSQVGLHLFFSVDTVPDNINVRVEGVGGFEIRGNGQYVIAPPSPHPSGHQYTVYQDKPILHLQDHEIKDIRNWFESMRINTQIDRNQSIKDIARPTNIDTSPRKKAFLEVLVSQELARVETAVEGNRNKSLFYATLRISNYVAGGELNWSDMSNKLLQSARSIGMPEREAQRTIDSAWRIGSKNPRKVK